MALEIERKFRLKTPSILSGLTGARLLQAYVAQGPVLVRVRATADQAWLTLKTAPLGPATRHEWEYAIPVADALEMARQPGTHRLEKTRYIVEHDGHRYEVDEYHGGLKGLYTVEVELTDINQPLSLPDWVGEEVTGRREWDNDSLARQGWPTGHTPQDAT